MDTFFAYATTRRGTTTAPCHRPLCPSTHALHTTRTPNQHTWDTTYEQTQPATWFLGTNVALGRPSGILFNVGRLVLVLHCHHRARATPSRCRCHALPAPYRVHTQRGGTLRSRSGATATHAAALPPHPTAHCARAHHTRMACPSFHGLSVAYHADSVTTFFSFLCCPSWCGMTPYTRSTSYIGGDLMQTVPSIPAYHTGPHHVAPFLYLLPAFAYLWRYYLYLFFHSLSTHLCQH